MLPLEAPVWSTLHDVYGPADGLPARLRLLVENPTQADETFRRLDLWSSLCHQDTVATATYAALPYVVESARRISPERRVELLVFIGYAAACAHLSKAVPCPESLRSDYLQAIKEAAPLMAESLLCDWDKDTMRELLGAFAALQGYPELCFVLCNMDAYLECPACGAEQEILKSSLNPLQGC